MGHFQWSDLTLVGLPNTFKHFIIVAAAFLQKYVPRVRFLFSFHIPLLIAIHILLDFPA